MRAAVTGTFDGVHRGHVFLLDSLRREAALRGLEPLALTFSSHPLSVIAPERTPLSLTSVEERVRLIEEQGVKAEVLTFDEPLRRMTAADFLAMLRERYGVTVFLLGFNNTIGSDLLGAGPVPVEPVGGVGIVAVRELPGFSVCSSAIREALRCGDIAAANAMLGRPYAVEGEVVGGRRLGRTLGFPTANIDVGADRALPAAGVYVGRVLGRRAVVNIGRRPTVEGRDDAPLSVEAHLLDFCGDLYGRRLRLELFARLRGERRFASLDALKAAIANDIIAARRYEC